MDIKTILSKPLPVIWYRFVQLIKLVYFAKINFWQKKEKFISKMLNKSSSIWKQKSKLFKIRGKDDYCNKQSINTINSADAILEGKISIFDVIYEFTFPLQWNEDWRYAHKWENDYYKNYSFYEKEKTIPYDVKFPWELSRLSFLIPVARAYIITEEFKYLNFITKTLKDWKSNNPIAYSVNWYAMEVSVRSINLIQLREILLLAKNTNKTILLLNRILILHGIFLWRNIEYTDVRGNHYSANLTALLLLGNVFKDTYKEAKKWFNYAVNRIEKEFHLQFTDGVNFEKSTQYHRLVVEFYLISFLLFKRIKINISKQTIQNFKKAAYFIKDYTKPDGSTPVFGDNDSASIFNNEPISLNRHTNILQLTSFFLEDNNLNISQSKYNSTFELFGTQKLKQNSIQNNFKTYNYISGGFVIAKKQANYFIVDVGEVGMNGRGGHGHNDLFSFELFIENKNLIVDPGCYTYTGDLKLKNEIRSSKNHNILIIDDKEIAPILNVGVISDIARPNNILLQETDKILTISGQHNGYKRLEQKLNYKRTFIINKENFHLQCKDIIFCKNNHTIKRFLHFSEDVILSINKNCLLVSLDKNQYEIIFDIQTQLKIEMYTLSYNYGQKLVAQRVVAKSFIDKTTTLMFEISERND